jgi:hypothetical protein
MAYPVFASGDVLNASDMNAVGLWLIKSQTVGTAVSSVTVSGAFSSTYDNYRIIYSGGNGSTGHALGFKLGSVATGYYGVLDYAAYTANTPLAIGNNNTTSWQYAGSGDSTYTDLNCDLINPNLAKPTLINAFFNGASAMGVYVGKETSTTQHTAFTLTPDTGTLTGGTIRVYGWRN